ncbi:MAG: hypothetical protein WBD40_08835 [Tepidisphaeraceae bacterium]
MKGNRWQGGQFRELIEALALYPEPVAFPVSLPENDNLPNVRAKIILEAERHGVRVGTSRMKDGRILVFRKPVERSLDG